MREDLARMDVSYIRGRKRDPRADSKVNVAFSNAYLEKKLANLSARLEVAYVEQQPPAEIAPAPTMEELQNLSGEATDKVHCSNIMGEMDTSAQFEEYKIAL
ncbi:hypothetical protein PC110_g17247 [Phytophthora cactorum]|uniref:Uncharacterized protein n=2 Tax=Phytophthora cactorum TaxID=29920 RepID=A0A329RNV8_9STRA|nr:hypothetical protein PC115_g9183 [Phytophthora cactorum]RAW26345.1 hypothetical protein PC110_g17247 [Phytophthora cactorum]